MKKITLASALAATALFATLSTASAAPSVRDIQPGSYTVETAHTQVVFSLLHMGFTPYKGLFSGATGTLQIDPKAPAATKLSITIPVSSIATTSDVLTGELKAADWFDVAHYPTATFISSGVTPSGAGNATVTGTLTLHGVSKPAVLHVHFVGAGVNPLDKAYTIGFEASATIKRSDFGVSKYVPMVGDEVTLSIAGAFEKQS